MPRYLLEHDHEPRECGVAFASFNAVSRVSEVEIP
jgi:hypothetical protein